MKNKKVVVHLVLNNFTNDSRVLKEADSLQANGYDVNVVALHEPPLNEYESLGDVSVHRVKLVSRSWPKYRFIQIIKYFEFAFRVILKYRRADVFHCNDLSALPIGVMVKLILNRKTKVVYDAHEFEIHVPPNQSYLSMKIKYYLEKSLIKHADKVITVSNSIANGYEELYAISKPSLILNCPRYEVLEKQDVFRDELDIRKEQIIFLYQGVISHGSGIEILLDAFSGLDTDQNIVIFMGYGSLKGLVKDYAKKYSTIYFREAVSPNILLNYTSSADYGISFVDDTCLSYRYCLPNKIFEYIMAGIPVLTSNLFEMKNLVEKYDLGIVTQSNTAQGICDAVNKLPLRDHIKTLENVHKAAKLYNWEAQEKKLMDVYNEL